MNPIPIKTRIRMRVRVMSAEWKGRFLKLRSKFAGYESRADEDADRFPFCQSCGRRRKYGSASIGGWRLCGSCAMKAYTASSSKHGRRQRGYLIEQRRSQRKTRNESRLLRMRMVQASERDARMRN